MTIKGPSALAHRNHRHTVGRKMSRNTIPHYQSGPRHGQQLAAIRKARKDIQVAAYLNVPVDEVWQGKRIW